MKAKDLHKSVLNTNEWFQDFWFRGRQSSTSFRYARDAVFYSAASWISGGIMSLGPRDTWLAWKIQGLRGWHMCRASFIRRLERCKVTAASAMHGLCVS